AFLDSYGLIAIFGIMLVKSVGVPIPIPADVVMLAASARAASGKLDVISAFAALLVALSVGGLLQFALIRGVGRGLLLRYGRFLGITEARLDTVARRMEKSGVIGIGLAILTPGIRSVTIPACGIAGIALARFVTGLVLGSGAFLALHFALGLLGGSLLGQAALASSPAVVIGVIIGLLAGGFGTWYVIRRRQHPDDSAREVLAAAAGAWHEATCPVCLALGAVDRLQIDVAHVHVGARKHGGTHVHSPL
ncbi:MAG: VTT domain-containing protein, partial [Anaerolineae bacterium]|nr:VTT domain-containing protein [Anaerolineae bacterium]